MTILTQRAPKANGRPKIDEVEQEEARLWLQAAISEAKKLATYDQREARDVYAALRTLCRLAALRGEAIVREFREYLELAPEKTRAMIAGQRERQRPEPPPFLAALPPPNAHAST